ncbi:hypothetical protein AMK59_2472 [Oryctes borbonicus]|uniref:Uncharacterized protein n=1 Tax=Oryctes borbonicus TaxID=1629725 RepID=A0A0T6BG56_9SCAR|nr:hypothetical protein AMK59_2472 [Oryctes borbonicus]
MNVLYPPEVTVVRSWSNTGEGLEARLDCLVHSDPPAEVKIHLNVTPCIIKTDTKIPRQRSKIEIPFNSLPSKPPHSNKGVISHLPFQQKTIGIFILSRPRTSSAISCLNLKLVFCNAVSVQFPYRISISPLLRGLHISDWN